MKEVKKVIYCLPGTMCDQRLWQFLQAGLNGIMLKHVVLPMAPSIEQVVDDLANYLPETPIYLLGFSMGGYIASAFSVKFPNRVKQLMVISNAADGLVESEVNQRKQALDWVRRQGYKGIPKKKAMAMLGERNRQKAFLLDIIHQMDESLGESVFIQQLSSSLERPTLLTALACLTLPICFCFGESDALISEKSKVFLNQINAFESHQVSHCGHMIPLEQPLWLCQKINHFFTFE